MMSGCGILTNGKGTRREYCEFSLDELQVRGDTDASYFIIICVTEVVPKFSVMHF